MIKMSGIKIAQIHCGKDILDVTIQDKQARCYFNHIDVVGAQELYNITPIVGMLIMSSCRTPTTKIQAKSNPSYGNFLKDMINTVTKSDQAKIQVLEEKPDEMTDNKPKESKFNVDVLENYREGTQSYCNCYDSTLALSDVLLKTKLPKSASTFKEIDKVLAGVRNASVALSKNRESYELAAEHTGSRVGQIMTAIRSNRLNDSNIKKLLQTAVNHVTADFLTMKKYLASLVLSHYPLYDIDRTFKKHTGYPATWFFDPSVYYNFTERYKDASDGLIEAVRAEASVVRPLYAWHLKVTGDL